ncbi:flagellar brake protein [Halalkalibacter urbisdiaboli]|uniref:flagellar brake protein n=1 Tax=Halalkalibacter urbisdiaboli TaxID=1960589 RepID=UPI000B454E5B|nr:flagellar brake domain-containing protein [Halalkalibacter urbisdiaboli]
MIDIGATIFLELQETKGEETKTINLRCRLVDKTTKSFVIDYPINQETNKPNFFFDGTQFRAWFIGKDEAMYAFDTEITGRKKGNIPMLLLKDPGREKYLRIQRRNYVRVDTSTDAAVHTIHGDFQPFTTVTLDLSGGGCAILIPPEQKLPGTGELNLYMVLHMQSGKIEYVKTRCKIIRVFKPIESARERASLQFLEIDERERQKIIKYCFERQLALKRKK